MMSIKGDSVLPIPSIIRFYSFLAIISFFVKPEYFIPICIRMNELTLVSLIVLLRLLFS